MANLKKPSCFIRFLTFAIQYKGEKDRREKRTKEKTDKRGYYAFTKELVLNTDVYSLYP